MPPKLIKLVPKLIVIVIIIVAEHNRTYEICVELRAGKILEYEPG
jgi:hypothetical protein